MRFNDARHDAFAAQVDFLRAGSGGLEDVGIGSDGGEAIALDGDGLRAGLALRHRDDGGVVVDDVGRLGPGRTSREQGKKDSHGCCYYIEKAIQEVSMASLTRRHFFYSTGMAMTAAQAMRVFGANDRIRIAV